jgi:hypothetical protein
VAELHVINHCLITGMMLVMKFLASFRLRGFNTMFTRARHCSLSWAIWLQFTLLYPIPLKVILIIPFYICMCLQEFFSFQFVRSNFCEFFITHMPKCSCLVSAHKHNNVLERLQIIKFPIFELFQRAEICSLFGPKTLFSTLYPQLYSSLTMTTFHAHKKQ